MPLNPLQLGLRASQGFVLVDEDDDYRYHEECDHQAGEEVVVTRGAQERREQLLRSAPQSDNKFSEKGLGTSNV